MSAIRFMLVYMDMRLASAERSLYSRLVLGMLGNPSGPCCFRACLVEGKLEHHKDGRPHPAMNCPRFLGVTKDPA